MPNDILITPGSASVDFSGSAANTIKLQVEPSGSVAFYGTSGSLFSIVDSLEGSLMSVNDVSGIPILEVFSDDRVVMGTFGQNTLVVNGSNVGIGTATPNTKLQVVGNITATTFTGPLTGNAATATTAENLKSNATTGVMQIVGPAAATTRVMTIPNANFTVARTDAAQTFTGTQTFSSTIAGSINGNAATATTLATTRSLWGQNFNGSANVTGNLTSVGNITGTAGVTLTATAGTLGLVATGANIITATTNAAERLRITSGGQVNIGGNYTSTTNTLQITGNAAIGYTTAAPTNGLIVNGNVGIGTANAVSKLTITDGATPYATATGEMLQIKRNTTNGTDAAQTRIRLANNSNGFSIAYGGTSDRLRFTDGGTGEVLSLVNGGNVGIGTISPAQKLHVNGNAQLDGNLILGTQTNKATITYTTNTLRTYTIPDAGGAANFVMTAGNQSIGGIKTFTGGAGAITITNSDIRSNAASTWTGDPGTQGKIQYHSNRWYIVADSASNRIVQFRRNGTDVSHIDNSGNYVGNVTGNATNVTGTVAVANGGTGATTLTANKLLIGNGTSAVFTNNNLHWDNTNTRLGIGTVSPNRLLTVSGAIDGELRLANFQNTSTGTNAYSEINLTANTAIARIGLTNAVYPGGQWTNGGMYILLPGNINFGPGNAYTTVMNSNGRMGIGTLTPNELLEVAGNIHVSGGNRTIYNRGNNALSIGTNNTARLHITNTGLVGIGITTPQKILDVVNPANDFVSVGTAQMSVGQWTGIHFGYRENNNIYRKSAIVFQRTDLTSNNAQGKIHILNGPQAGTGNATLSDARLTIAENGNVGIGTTSPNSKLEVFGSGGTVFDVQGSAGQLFSVTDNLTGVVFSVNDISGIPIIEAEAGALNAVTVTGQFRATNEITAYFSDERLKEKVGNIDSPIDIISSLNGFKYVNNKRANDFGYHDTKVQVGLSAQEVQAVLPEIVLLAPFDTIKDDDGNNISRTGENYLTMDYAKLVPVLIEAIKEQQNQINELRKLLEIS
jgi:hypothetical protein